MKILKIALPTLLNIVILYLLFYFYNEYSSTIFLVPQELILYFIMVIISLFIIAVNLNIVMEVKSKV